VNRPGRCGGIATHPSPVRREATALQHARPQSERGQRAGTVDYRIYYSSGVGDWDIYLTSEIRILFVFDPWRSAILLVAGDKSGKWNRWYAEAIPHAEQLYEIYLKERAEEETGR
jgi:Phage derived protein Gp49-like (DUF891)